VAGLALLAALAAGCSTAYQTAATPGATAHHHHSAPMHAAATSPADSANPIPQGNGGDHDPGNNGAPSDGDGNI
jgi:hypothetical protein